MLCKKPFEKTSLLPVDFGIHFCYVRKPFKKVRYRQNILKRLHLTRPKHLPFLKIFSWSFKWTCVSKLDTFERQGHLCGHPSLHRLSGKTKRLWMYRSTLIAYNSTRYDNILCKLYLPYKIPSSIALKFVTAQRSSKPWGLDFWVQFE